MSEVANQFKPGKPRFGYRNGKLYYFDRLSVLVLAPWPKPQAWFKNSRVGWHSSRKRADKVFTPALFGRGREDANLPDLDDPELYVWSGDPTNLDPIEYAQYRRRWRVDEIEPQAVMDMRREVLAKRAERERLREGVRYLHQMQARYFDKIPDGVRAELLRYTSRRWHLMCLFARCPEALDLSRSNPALCYALASNWVFHKPAVKRPLRAARSLIGKKQKHILGWLGFPATESVRRLLKKIVPEALDVLLLLDLRRLFSDQEVIHWLAHMRKIDYRLLRTITSGPLRPLLTERLLREIDARPNTNMLYPPEVRMLWDVLNLMQRAHEGLQGPFRTYRQLEACHDELARRDREAIRNRLDSGLRVKFPSPPFAGTEDIRPLRSEKDLYGEGGELLHCVGIYADRIRSGCSYIYQVLAPVRATMEIVYEPSLHQWVPGQLRMKRNQPVNGAVAQELFSKVFASGPYVPVEGEDSGEEGEGLAAIRTEEELWEGMGQQYLFG